MHLNPRTGKSLFPALWPYLVVTSGKGNNSTLIVLPSPSVIFYYCFFNLQLFCPGSININWTFMGGFQGAKHFWATLGSVLGCCDVHVWSEPWGWSLNTVAWSFLMHHTCIKNHCVCVCGGGEGEPLEHVYILYLQSYVTSTLIYSSQLYNKWGSFIIALTKRHPFETQTFETRSCWRLLRPRCPAVLLFFFCVILWVHHFSEPDCI